MRLTTKRLFSTLAITALGLALSMPNSFSHTKLVSANPAAGSVITQWPDQISIEFDEDLINIGDEKTNFIVVNNAVGDQISNNDETIESNIATVSLSPNEIEGPVLVFYRVISADGHPVEGEYTFTFGQDQPVTEVEITETSSTYPISIYIASAAFIASGIFFAIYSYRRRNRG